MGESPAALLVRARTAAGLTQRELAQRAGTSQPALARYESGAALPTLPTLERLLLGCGRRLELSSTAVSGAGTPATSVRGQLGTHAQVLRASRTNLLRAARRHGVRDVSVFGSVARGDATPDSDYDLLVGLDPGRTLLDLAAFQGEAQEILGSAVDVATRDMLKGHVLRDAARDALPL